MFMTELANLAITLAIITGPFLLVWVTRASLWPMVVAMVYTILAVIASGMIHTPSYGYGGWLMLTVPFSPVLLLYGWLVAKLSHWWLRRRWANRPGPVRQFGRSA